MVLPAACRDDDVLLVPVEDAYALRPSLAHLGTTRAEAEAKAAAEKAVADKEAAQQQAQAAEDEDKAHELQPLTVSSH